ncbi:hypothetical protein [Caulobacter sp. RL271]|uniref:DUF4376 domain-containing protein n=1 Tax=Caulobacter segnis TaxID=88688 RepID=A0ABY4ZWU6_9CAUL|nr:hypothetical protein [Caulobacter segnis]USQ97246.1 hypothetical protein MZV50_06805 [Caulobacter segnis]
MSLATMALRICTVLALFGRTDAGDRVADSEIRALDDEVEGGVGVAVYVDEMSATGGLADFGAGEGSAQLVVEILATTRGPDSSLGVPQTGSGLELAIDLVEHQVRRALLDETVVWSRLWRQLTLKQGTYKFERGANKANGVRLAGREISMTCGLLADPPIGAPLPIFWTDFLAALAVEPLFAEVYDKIVAVVTGEPLASWRQDQAAQALTANAVREIGVTPPFETIDDEAPETSEIEIVADD